MAVAASRRQLVAAYLDVKPEPQAHAKSAAKVAEPRVQSAWGARCDRLLRPAPDPAHVRASSMAARLVSLREPIELCRMESEKADHYVAGHRPRHHSAYAANGPGSLPESSDHRWHDNRPHCNRDRASHVSVRDVLPDPVQYRRRQVGPHPARHEPDDRRTLPGH